MTTDRILGAGVYRLIAEEYRADIAHHRALPVEDNPAPATDAAVLAVHLAIAEAVFSATRPAPVRHRRRWWPW